MVGQTKVGRSTTDNISSIWLNRDGIYRTRKMKSGYKILSEIFKEWDTAGDTGTDAKIKFKYYR